MPVFLDTGGNEGRAGDLTDVIVRPVSWCSAYQVRQMSQTGRSGQLWCHKGEYEIFAAISVEESAHACENLPSLCSTSVSGMRSRSCQQASRRVSAVQPHTQRRALVSSGSSTESCCEFLPRVRPLLLIRVAGVSHCFSLSWNNFAKKMTMEWQFCYSNRYKLQALWLYRFEGHFFKMKDELTFLLTLILATMEAFFQSSALLRWRTPLSLPSWRSPSTKVMLSFVQLFWTFICGGYSSSLKSLISPTASPPGPYWVLSTDYEGHALVYSCTQFGPFSAELTWILSRKPTLSKETMEQLHGILTAVGVNVDKMVPTNQDETYCRAMDQ